MTEVLNRHPYHPNLPEKMRDGVYLFCNNLECKAQEVLGNGKSVKEAYEVVTAKYPLEKKKDEEERIPKKPKVATEKLPENVIVFPK